MSIPTMIFFKGGKPVDKVVGALPKETLEQKIKEHMN
jgi:thioredoxin 1